MRTFRSNDFELNFLEGWRDDSQIVLIGPDRPAFTPNLQVHREELPAAPLDEYFREQRAELAKLDQFRLIDHGDRRLGGEQALYHAYSWTLPNQPGMRVRQLQVAAARGSTLFTVTASALEQDWDQVEAGFELSLAGFRWT